MMMLNRLLHPKHLDKMWIGQDQYRLLIIFSGLNKNRVPDMGEKWFGKIHSARISVILFLPALKKTESKKFIDSVFFRTISPPCLGLSFYSDH